MIVCFGDSIAYGQHLPDRSKAWPSLLTGTPVVNAGVPSDTTRLGLERFPADVQMRRPMAVIIQFGHNDANRWATDYNVPRVSKAAYAANLVEMTDRARAFGIVPVLCSLTPSRRSVQHEADVEEYNEILLGVAEETDTCLVDVRQKFGDAEGLLMGDGLHLTAEGHRVYAAAVQEIIGQDLVARIGR